ncbi:hypothetical protein FACS189459_5250 [Bacilli bacterium]|nr:hypothetical protein FACS189459_5140 [Bacilli bacterium]GHU50758.1 hypothetical protein FACS189459_5250 [Bacilli bacterium]
MSRKYISNTNFYEYDNGVLKNKLNIQNQEEFDKAENDLVSLRITRYIKNNFELTKFDLNDLCGIHKFLFQTIYD